MTRRRPRLPNVLSFWRDPLGFYARLAREQGDVARARIGGRSLVLVNHPGLVRDLLTRSEGFAKGFSLTRTRLLLGSGLLTSEGELHRRQRRLIQPAFSTDRVALHAGVVARHAADAADSWRDGEAFDVAPEMMRLAQRTVARALFAFDVQDADARAAGAALDDVIRGFHLLLLPFASSLVGLPLPAMARLRRARASLDALVLRMIEERRAEGDRGDVLSMLLLAKDDAGAGMDARQVRDEAMTIFLAGHDTTGNALAWTWKLLASEPDVEQAFHAELDRVLSGRLPTTADLPALDYTRKLVAESMRLYPPVWSLGRQALEDGQVGGHAIRRGDIVQACQWLLHRDPRFWDEPERCRPERWTPAMERILPKGAYFPFGLGPRTCIGLGFAQTTTALALATIGQRWRLRLVPGHPVQLLPRITLRPRHGLLMRPERR